LTNAPQAYGVLLKTGDQKKATRRWHFLEAEKITSSLQQEQRQVQQLVQRQVLQQEQRQQVQQQGLRQQELGLLFLPQATKAAANNVAKRSDFFMGVFPLIETKTFQGVPYVRINSNM